MRKLISFFCLATSLLILSPMTFAHPDSDVMKWVQIGASNKFQRTDLVNLGLSIEGIRSDSVWGFATDKTLTQIRAHGFQILSETAVNALDFPASDARFHNYAELLKFIQDLKVNNPDLIQISSIGQSIEKKHIPAIRFTTGEPSENDKKPGIVFMGGHHAREHVSIEMPIMLMEYLVAHQKDPQIQKLLSSRDIWIIPVVNPDGAEYDIATGNYKSWRKNRRNNGDGTYGVDLNRNYGYQWGTGGSSKDTSHDTYMGTAPFSEPETLAIKKFIEERSNLKVLLSFHTFSELILYPWGHTNNSISNAKDRDVFETMAKTMAQWNKYKPEQSSDLYIASGDTTDWAYGTRGIFAFTFELSPSGLSGPGGFYPGAKILDKVFQDNLKPCLYLMDVAEDPYKVLNGNRPSRWFPSLIEAHTQPIEWLN